MSHEKNGTEAQRTNAKDAYLLEMINELQRQIRLQGQAIRKLNEDALLAQQRELRDAAETFDAVDALLGDE